MKNNSPSADMAAITRKPIQVISRGCAFELAGIIHCIGPKNQGQEVLKILNLSVREE